MTNILVAGNPDYGLTQAIEKKFPDAKFCSRSHGDWDLSIPSMQREFAQLSLEYDVVIIVSCIWKFNQTVLVQEICKQWFENKKDGYLIVLGSSADTPVKGTTWMYPAEKKALRAYCRQISQAIAGENDIEMKLTYLSPGNLHTSKQDEKMPDVPKLNLDYIVGVIQWLILQPVDVNISELCLDRKIVWQNTM